ncbi:twin transmembrane helix small protein [Comamonas aquatilis]|uniref:twin transmembrane helix small protein n=1 Tax=Comamonas TaxID=283 RepID=UPI000EB12702|nr:twin transmembrane helix small protein [Comamonas sp. lk]
MKFIIILAFLAILASLGSALFFMMRKGDDSRDSEADDALRRRKMFRALAWRVALSITLFVCILLAAKLGYIQPTGWQPGQ